MTGRRRAGGPEGGAQGSSRCRASSGAASRHAALLPVAEPGQRVDRARCRAVCSVHYLRFCFQSVNYLHCVMLFVCAKNTHGLERTLRRQGGSLKAHRKVKTRADAPFWASAQKSLTLIKIHVPLRSRSASSSPFLGARRQGGDLLGVLEEARPDRRLNVRTPAPGIGANK